MDVCELQRLHSQGVLDLAWRSESLGGLVEELTLPGRLGDCLQAQRSHGDKQQDDKEGYG